MTVEQGPLQMDKAGRQGTKWGSAPGTWALWQARNRAQGFLALGTGKGWEKLCGAEGVWGQVCEGLTGEKGLGVRAVRRGLRGMHGAEG